MPQKYTKYSEEATWDKKKLAILLSLVFIFGASLFAAKKFLFPQAKSRVQGIQTLSNEIPSPAVNKSSFYLPTSQDIQQKMEDIQKQVIHLNIDQIASSSPEVRQIIQQLQNLPNLPKDAARSACEDLCRNIK